MNCHCHCTAEPAAAAAAGMRDVTWWHDRLHYNPACLNQFFAPLRLNLLQSVAANLPEISEAVLHVQVSTAGQSAADLAQARAAGSCTQLEPVPAVASAYPHVSTCTAVHQG